MTLPKINRSNRFLVEQMKFVINSGVSVDWNSTYSTVSIYCEGSEGVFMQGHEAEEFINQIELITRRFRSFSEYHAALVLAYDYLDLLVEA